MFCMSARIALRLEALPRTALLETHEMDTRFDKQTMRRPTREASRVVRRLPSLRLRGGCEDYDAEEILARREELEAARYAASIGGAIITGAPAPRGRERTQHAYAASAPARRAAGTTPAALWGCRSRWRWCSRRLHALLRLPQWTSMVVVVMVVF